MCKINSRDELKTLRDNALAAYSAQKQTVVSVGMATCSMAAGAKDTLQALRQEAREAGIDDISFVSLGCIGLCYAEPLVEIRRPGKPIVRYGNVGPEQAREIVNKCLVDNREFPMRENLFDHQVRVALRNCGAIDPENLREYIAAGGYDSLAKSLFELGAEGVAETVKVSGLRGRGGAGFPTGLKWEICAKSPGAKKYVICNADEGDPGAFMDRSILEGDPHSVLEAMAICGFAVGADEGIIYIRAEYPLAVRRLKTAVEQAEHAGLLGENILGSGFDFSVSLSLGAGAFVCGEETSLMNSVQGGRGEPRIKPPFPAQKGLHGCPTNINNVETFANIPPIITNGADWFHCIGTEKSPGTKVFALAGKINKVGLAEVPMGTPLRVIIEDIGGGVRDGKPLKAVQIGGPSGGCLPASMLDTPVDYESLGEIGCPMGSGGMIAIDGQSGMVDMAKYFLEFTAEESCGKCTPCRIGNRRLLEILRRMTDGKGEPGDIELLKTLGEVIRDTSLCGLGQGAPNPVLSMIRHFPEEYRT